MRTEDDVQIESLDNAFLFMIASAGLIFSALQVVLQGKSALLLFSPYLFSGVAYPFYVGYLRGAVERSWWKASMLQRLRGWVYFGVGITVYVTMAAVTIFRESVLSFFAYYIGIGLGIWLSYRLIRWVVRAVDAYRADEDLFVIRCTCVAAFLLTVSCYFFEEGIRLQVYPPIQAKPPYIGETYWAFLCLLAFVVTERVSIASLAPEVRFNWMIEKHRSRSSLEKTTLYSLVAFAVGLATNRVTFWLTAISFGPLLLFLYLSGSSQSYIGDAGGILAPLLLYVATFLYLRMPIERIRSRIPTTKEEFRALLRGIFGTDG